MAMSRKDFEAIASVVRLLANDGTRLTIAGQMADVLAKSNKAFDRERFLLACDAFIGAGSLKPFEQHKAEAIAGGYWIQQS